MCAFAQLYVHVYVLHAHARSSSDTRKGNRGLEEDNATTFESTRVV